MSPVRRYAVRSALERFDSRIVRDESRCGVCVHRFPRGADSFDEGLIVGGVLEQQFQSCGEIGETRGVAGCQRHRSSARRQRLVKQAEIADALE